MVRDEGLDEKTFILAGVTPAKSDKALKYMQTVPGLKVPDEGGRYFAFPASR